MFVSKFKVAIPLRRHLRRDVRRDAMRRLSCIDASPCCLAPLANQRCKRVCSKCGRIIESCCDGGEGGA
ncbi:MAG: hypothetical protein EA376_00825 [Phycisphaeraceae bacterium]|nr:MAG: hypothetical protein EA376_00825 [Phycisphaeraceae bacterium]